MSEPVPGGKLVMYNDNIQGEYIALDENKRVEMNWKFKDWEDYSHVLITLDEGDDEDVSKSQYYRNDF